MVAQLEAALRRGALAHAYLIVGPPHVGKMKLAENLAQALNCQGEAPPCQGCPDCTGIAAARYSDVQIIRPLMENGDRPRKEISIEQVRELQRSAYLPPFQGRRKVFIVEAAELLSLEAANCLLKTLEEPPAAVVFLLLTSQEPLLPATVVSRCHRLELGAVPRETIEGMLVRRGATEETARLLARLSRGCPGWALAALEESSLLQERRQGLEMWIGLSYDSIGERFARAAQLATRFEKDRAGVKGVLELGRGWWRDLLLVKGDAAGHIVNVDQEAALAREAATYSWPQIRSALESLEAAQQQLELNANPRLALEVLMLNLPRKESPVGR